MSTMRAYSREFRESAVGLVLTEGIPIRKAADDLGLPYHTLHGWVRAVRRARRKPVSIAGPRTRADAEARVRELEAEVRKLLLERDIQSEAEAYFAREQPSSTPSSATNCVARARCGWRAGCSR
jgi:transposase